MKKIQINSLNLDYPIFNSSSLSLRKKIISNIGGNLINKNHKNNISYVRSLNNINLEIDEGEKIKNILFLFF